MLLIEDRLEAARTHAEAGRSENAMLLYESVLDIDPSCLPALAALARIALEKGDLEKAFPYAAAAAERTAADADVLALFARVALMAQKPDHAAAAIEQALAVAPAHPDSSKIRAAMVSEAGDVVGAEKGLQEALRHHPDDGGLLAALSELYAGSGRPVPALDLAQKALALEPDNPERLALVGGQLAALGDHEKALPFLERAHLAEPGHPLFMVMLVDALAALGELSAAHRLARRAVVLFAAFLPAWGSYTRVMTLRGEARAGLAEFVPVARQHQEKIAALVTLAGAYRVAGEPAEALRLLQPLLAKLTSLSPAEVSGIAALARDCALSLGHLDAAAMLHPGFDLRAALGLPPKPVASTETAPPADDEAGTPTDAAPDPELVAALAETAFVIDESLSSLEALVLMRFRPHAPQPGKAIDIYGPSSLAPVAAMVEGVRFRPDDQPAAVEPDRVIRALPLSSVLALPTALRGDAAASGPYLHPPAAGRALWRRSLEGLPRPLVALAWDATRPGLLLEDYRSVLGDFDGTLVSVMWEEPRHQLRSWREIIDAGVHFKGLDDLAAVLAEVDAVIGPDGLALHMAGAMGRPGALLSQPAPPWYWYAGEGTSFWYPSLAVLKTATFGNWQTLMPGLRPDLDTLLGRIAGAGDGHETVIRTADASHVVEGGR